MLKMQIYPIIVSGFRRVIAATLTWLYNAQERIIVVVTIATGMTLALGLYSPARALTIAIAGISIYCATIVINPLQGLALWMVTQPLLEKYLNISLGTGIPDLSLTRICIALITTLLAARAAVKLYPLHPINKFDILAFAFMMGMAQAGFRGNRGISTFQNVFDLYFVPMLVYFAVKNLVSDRRSMYLVLHIVLIIALYSAVYAIYETTTGNVLFTSRVYKSYSYTDSGLHILRGIWGSNVGFGRVFVTAIPILFYFYLKASSPFRKSLYGICAMLVFIGLFLTYKRTAWIAMLIVIFVMQLFYPQFRKLFIVLSLVIAVAITLNLDTITSSTVYNDRVNSNLSTVEDRTEGWKNGIAVWSTDPLVGIGFRQYQKYAIRAGYHDLDLENGHLDILVSAGLAGFLPYVGLIFLMIYDGYRHYRGRVVGSLADPDLVAVFWGILAGYVITIATSQINNLVISTMTFAVAGAVIYARREAAIPTRSELKQKSANPALSVS